MRGDWIEKRGEKLGGELQMVKMLCMMIKKGNAPAVRGQVVRVSFPH